MQLGRARLASAERLWGNRVGECICCGQTGHFLASVLFSQKRMLTSNIGGTGEPDHCHFSPRMQLDATLVVNQQSLPLCALMDPGEFPGFQSGLASRRLHPTSHHPAQHSRLQWKTPWAFFSRCLLPAEHYDICNRELMKLTLKEWRHCLEAATLHCVD